MAVTVLVVNSLEVNHISDQSRRNGGVVVFLPRLEEGIVRRR